MKSFGWFSAAALALTVPSEASNVRDNNGGNCDGLTSCRPRCITFRIDRNNQECDSSQGIFNVVSNLNPWDVSEFKTFNCEASKCVNNLCGLDLFGDLTVRIGEFGESGSMYYSSVFIPGDGEERFTYCSVYPCPKDECAVPEQMGSRLQFDFLPGVVNLDETADYVLRLEMHLKQLFEGPPLQEIGQNRFGGPPLQEIGKNRFGPLHVEWMDDPTGCRDGEFSPYAPVTPEAEPTILTTTSLLAQSRYCSGADYDPTDLPGTLPPTPPTSSPSSAPSASPAPTSLSAVQIEQLDALEIFYASTQMNLDASASRHDWFEDLDYCNWQGITCDNADYVRIIDLPTKRLSGSLPTEIANLQRLNHLKLVNNNIGGTVPVELAELANLTHVLLGANEIVGDIPTELGALQHLRRLMLQNNQLSGTIPDELCNLGESLLAFDISGSVHMHGEIPACFGNLTLLEALRVDNVGLVGTVPDGLCDVRPFNGLYPNLYGCWAIACPAGTYEPIYGREDGNQTACLPCHPVESNVIGSKTCMLVDGNTVLTMAPTVTSAPSMQPSIAPSALPSRAPSAAPIDTSPSQEPSLAPSPTPIADPITDAPSATPSMTDATTAPTVSPTVSNPSVYVTVLFHNVSTAMTEVDDIQAFELITQEYLIETGVPSVQQVEVISQSVRPPTEDDPLVSVQYPSRRVLSEEALFVAMQVEGDGSDNNDFEDSVVSALENTDDYQDALSQELDLFTTPTLPGQSTEIKDPKPQGKKSNINWKLLGSALGLSVLAVATVVMVRRFRKQDPLLNEPRYSETRRPTSTIPQPEDHVHPNSNVNNMYDESLSEESSGGWASEESEEDFVNQDTGTSIAGWSMSQNNELCLMSSQGSKSMV